MSKLNKLSRFIVNNNYPAIFPLILSEFGQLVSNPSGVFIDSIRSGGIGNQREYSQIVLRGSVFNFVEFNTRVYSITKESNHLLIFGVPSLNLRLEIKSLFIKFGKLLQFTISNHAAERFTETYHAQFERIQSARMAKKMIDTKNFYGGLLHVCYAPELENVNETRQKLIQRQRDVVFRLRNLEKEGTTIENKPSINQEVAPEQSLKVNMGEVNIIRVGTNNVKQIKKDVIKKRKIQDKDKVKEKKFKSDFLEIKNVDDSFSVNNGNTQVIGAPALNKLEVSSNTTAASTETTQRDIDIVDCTSADIAVVTNINEHLNYNKFGNEVVRKVLQKPVNKIKFHVNKKS